MKTGFLYLAGALALALGLAACQPREMPTAANGRVLFQENCAGCHGDTGRGDGPWAAGLARKPADLTQLFAKGYDRAKILSIIDGYKRPGSPTPMPEFGADLGGATVPLDVGDGRMTPVPEALAALLLYIESLQETP